MQTLAKRASVTVQKLYVISALRTTLDGVQLAPELTDSNDNFYVIKTMYYMSL